MAFRKAICRPKIPAEVYSDGERIFYDLIARGSIRVEDNGIVTGILPDGEEVQLGDTMHLEHGGALRSLFAYLYEHPTPDSW